MHASSSRATLDDDGDDEVEIATLHHGHAGFGEDEPLFVRHGRIGLGATEIDARSNRPKHVSSASAPRFQLVSLDKAVVDKPGRVHRLTSPATYEMFFCSISGEPPQDPVVSQKSGHVYERRLILKYITENGTDPITGDKLEESDLITIKASTWPKTAASCVSCLTRFSRPKDCRSTSSSGHFYPGPPSYLTK